jgi:hypothetical protein
MGAMGSGGVAQALIQSAAGAIKARIIARRGASGFARGESIMVWVVFEVLLAFGIAIFIVWWTFPKDKKDSQDTNEDQ